MSVLVATLAVTSASAQQTGEIRGRVLDGATSRGLGTVIILARSPSAIGEQFGFSEPDGTFVIPLLPPGEYEVSFELEGYRPRSIRNITVELGRTRAITAELVPTAIEGERIVVTAAETPTIDRGSFGSGTNINREFYRAVPSGRRYTEILQDTPGSVQDDVGTSVFGSTGVENTYIIEGLNTTDIGYGRAAADLNVDFFEEVEIKSAGYMPEFGRSTGGIFNLVLRSGGNDFHGDVFVNAAPGFLRASPTPIYRPGEAIGREDVPIVNLDAGFALGGPIIKDRLWFFAGFNPTMSFTDVNRIYQTQYDADGDGNPDLDTNGNPAVREVGRDTLGRTTLSWQFAGKLTFAVDADNQIAASYFGNPSSSEGVLRAAEDSRTNNGLNGGPDHINGDRVGGSHNVILNYAGQFFDRHLRVEAFAGFHTQADILRNRDTPVTDILYDTALSDLEPGRCAEDPATPFIDCPVSDYLAGGTGLFYDESLSRYTGGLRFTHLIENHTIRWGAEMEYKTYNSTRGYSGGYYALDYGASALDDPYNRERDYFARLDADGNPILLGTGGQAPFTADVATLTTTAYLQDLWEVNEYLTVGGGVRWDLEQMQDVAGSAAITIPDEIAPRLGVSFDPTGVGRSRIYASYGWFFESVPLDINQRSFSQEGTAIRYVDDAGNFICFDEEGNEVPAGTAGCTVDPYGVLGGVNSPVVNSLQGQYHDEFVLGADVELLPGWMVGVSAIARRLQRAIEDISPNDGNNYFIANPGVNDCDVPADYRDPLRDACSNDANGDGVLDDDEYDSGRTVFPKPTRLYQGLVFMTRKRLTDHFQVLASYTLSRLVGNYTGLYSGDNGQLDPNISSQYDLPDLLENRFGRLPNDHTHAIKIAGSYDMGGLVTDLAGLTVGLRYAGQSGAPISYLGRHAFYGRQEVFILPRGAGGETPWTHRVDLSIGYDVKLGGGTTLNFNATVFNLLNLQEVTAVNQEYTTDTIAPQADGTPLADLVNADGDAVNVSPTFGQPLVRQAPMYVRLGARLSF